MIDKSLKENFFKMFEKVISKDEPLNNYLLLLERRWKADWYRRLFPRWCFNDIVVPNSLRYENGELIRTHERHVHF